MNVNLDSPLVFLGVGSLAALIGSLFGAASSTVVPLPPVRLLFLAEHASKRASRLMRRYTEMPGRLAFRWQVARIGCVAVTAVFTGQAMRHVQVSWTVPVALLGTLAIYGVLVQAFSLLIRNRPATMIPKLFLLLAPLQAAVALFTFPLEVLANKMGAVKPSQVLPLQAPQRELGLLLEEGRREGSIEAEPLEMIKNVLELSEQTALEVMIPRTMIVAFSVNASVKDAVATFIETGHSRYPVYEESIDHVVGLLYAKDLFRTLQDTDLLASTVEPFVRRHVNFVPETKPASSLLGEMKMNRQHMAVVVDDFGGVSGIITLEDILEEIVGDIWDEHDPKKSILRQQDDGTVLVDASMGIDDLVRHLNVTIDHTQDVVSLAGWIVQQAKRVPSKGETFRSNGVVFTVSDSDDRHVTLVKLAREDGHPLRVSRS